MPKLSPLALHSGTKMGNCWLGCRQLPKALIVELGVYSPLFRAAV